MKRKLSLLLVLVMVFLSVSAVVIAKVEIEFWQNKREAVDVYKEIIAEFEEEYPDIEVVQNYQLDANTVLRSRLAQDNFPEVLTFWADPFYKDLASEGLLMEVSDNPNLEKVIPSYIDMMKELTGTDKRYGIPFAVNAQPVLYNIDKFEELGLSVPETWDEMLNLMDKIKEAGETPIVFTFQDSWTTNVPWAYFEYHLQPKDFFEKLDAGEITFQESYQEIAEKFLKFISYDEGDIFGRDYSQGNMAFARGDSILYSQGIWAIGPILESNPDINIGTFPFPVDNDPSTTEVPTGIDTVLAISEDLSPEKEDAARKFVNFLLRPEITQKYMESQRLFAAIEGVEQTEPELQGLQTYFEEGRVATSKQLGLPATMYADMRHLVQQFAIDKDIDEFLKTLDEEYNSY